MLYYFEKDNHYGFKKCRYKFNDFTGIYIGESDYPPDIVSNPVYPFTLDMPAYRIRFYVPISLKTIERTFKIFRQAIYDILLHKIRNLKLSGKIEIYEALFGVTREEVNVDGVQLSTKILYLDYTKEIELLLLF